MERLRKSKGPQYRPEMPPAEGGEYLLSYLWEVGPTIAAGGYPGPITNVELDRWCNRIGIDLQPWESRFLCRLSKDYLSESRRAEKADCPEPSHWSEESTFESKSLQESMRALAKL